jgi:hypothetical protein
VAVGATAVAVDGKAVGDAVIVDGTVTLIGAGVVAGDELQAVKIIPNPIATLNPKILKVFTSFMCLIVSP